jgi:isochorismate synthase EntC
MQTLQQPSFYDAGDVEQDFWLAFDLLRAPKDHVEFTLVRNWIRRQLGGVCSAVSVDRPKSVLKQVRHSAATLSQALRMSMDHVGSCALGNRCSHEQSNEH